MLEINKIYNEVCLSTAPNTHIKKDKSKKSLDSGIGCALVCRNENMASNVAIERFAIKLLELQKRLEVANNG